MKNIKQIINDLSQNYLKGNIKHTSLIFKKQSNLEQSGRSMVELMGYMAVVMVIVSGISKIISGAYGDYKMSQATIQISDLAGAITRASAIDMDYQEVIDNIQHLTEDGKKIIPSSFKIKGNNIHHVFGGATTIGCVGTTDNPNGCNKFFIQFPKLNRSQCIELSMKEWRTNTVVDLDSIVVNNENNIWTWPIYAIDANSKELPVLRSAVAGNGTDDGQCGNEDDKANDKWIRWIFN